jgi:hypothetical protein
VENKIGPVFWAGYIAVAALWVLDLMLLGFMTWADGLFDDAEPFRTNTREATLYASHQTGLPVLPVVLAALLSAVLAVMAARVGSRAMAWAFGACVVVIPVAVSLV